MHPSLTDDAEYNGGGAMEGFNNQSSRHYNNEGFLVLLMRTTLLIIHSITGSLALYFKGWYCCSGYLGIYWSSSSCFGLDQCTQLPTVRHLVYIYIRNLHLWIEYWSDFKYAIIAIAKRIINVIILLINTCRMVLRIYWYKGYLVSLAAADCIVLIASVPNEILWVYFVNFVLIYLIF